MHRHLGDQFPYAAFFWPAFAALSAGELASSFTAHFLGLDADDRAAQERDGATPGKIALDLHAVRLRDYSVAERACSRAWSNLAMAA